MNKNKKLKEIVMYIIFGVLTTIVSWGTYTVFVNNFDFSVAIANVLSWICAVAFAYITNKLWVFDSKSFKISVLMKEIATFVSSRLVIGVIEVVGVPLLAKTGFDNIFYSALEQIGITVNVLFTDGIYSKISLAIFVVIVNYIFSKLIVFKNKG